jgi:hypothetical protein
MRAEPDNCTPPTARSRLDQYGAILAGLQAVRPRCAAGAAPGPRLRVPRTQNTPETTEKRSQQPKARLDQLRRFRDDQLRRFRDDSDASIRRAQNLAEQAKRKISKPTKGP